MRGDGATSQPRSQLEKSEQFSQPSLKGTWDGEAEHCLTSLPCSPVPFTCFASWATQVSLDLELL